MEPFSDILGAGIMPLIGRLFLFLRYPNRAKRKRILESEYDSDYSAAGTIALFQLAGLVLIVLILGLIFISLFSSTFRS